MLTSIPKKAALSEEAYVLYDATKPTNRQKQQLAMRFLTDLHRVHCEFQQDLQDTGITDQQRDVLIVGLASIEEGLYPSQLNVPFRGVTEAEASLLKVCATFIDQNPTISNEDIACIRNSIAELKSQVEGGSISPMLRKVLLELIRLSEDAISRFNIEGPPGLKRAFKNMLGEASDIIGRLDSEEDRIQMQKTPAWTVLVKHLKNFDSVASKLLKYSPFLLAAGRMLLGGSEASQGE